MKTHKLDFTAYGLQFMKCGISRRVPFPRDNKVRTLWRFVTCKRCLAEKGRK